MYCPSCGTELIQELSYCNRCGANLKSTLNQSALPPTKFVGAAWAISVAIVLITLGGFGMIFALVMALIARGISLSAGGMVLVFFSLLVILAIAWLLVRQLSRLVSMPKLSGDVTQPQEPQISAPREPVSSVTEHTTRTFEPLYKERDTQR